VKVYFEPWWDDEQGGADPSRSEFIVSGVLEAKGNLNDSILFSSGSSNPNPGDWLGIRFVDSGASNSGSVLNNSNLFVDSNHLNELKSTSLIPIEKDSRFDFGKEDITVSMQPVSNQEFNFFIIEYANQGISVERSDSLEVKNSRISNSSDIGIQYASGGFLKIENNILNENSTGIRLDENSEFLKIEGNNITQNQTGIYCESVASPTILENQITNNLSYGVYIAGSANPNLGDSLMVGHNQIYGNGDYDVFNNTSNDISAEMNFWGTMDPDTVEFHIWDSSDDSSRGKVDFIPLWDGGGIQAGGPQSSDNLTLIKINALYQNQPNPFLKQTSIRYQLANTEHVSLKIYDIAGRLVSTLINKDKKAGSYILNWEGRDKNGKSVSSGVYFYRLKSGDFIATKKLIILR
jgi:parallel beta-helix repeat protein